ncbi:MAG: hypothetical protein AB7U75_14405 [Hyphomicrobiaceae bacterium]
MHQMTDAEITEAAKFLTPLLQDLMVELTTYAMMKHPGNMQVTLLGLIHGFTQRLLVDALRPYILSEDDREQAIMYVSALMGEVAGELSSV